MSTQNLIPQPQKITVKDQNRINWQVFKQFHLAGMPDASFAIVKKEFLGVKFHVAGAGFFAELSNTAVPGPVLTIPDKFSAYSLEVTTDRIRIDATDFDGLWSGLQTLRQLIIGELAALEIQDYPAIKYRSIHCDLKGYQPKFPVLLEEFRMLAGYKVNMVLLEIEDKYDFQCAPEVGIPGAYNFEEMRELSRYAAALNIKIVPKLQCLAHLDYMLKHKRYRSLREDNHPFQFCPCNPDSFELWKKMVLELLECFAEHHEYFHIGADEAIHLGACPECSKLGKANAFMTRVEPCIDFIIANGRTPIMWEDILRNTNNLFTPEDAAVTMHLGEKAILMYWAYGYGGYNNTFPYIPLYKSRGYRVWGASGYGGCDNLIGSLPPLAIRAQNITAWTKSAVENQVESVVATGWTKISSAEPPAEPHEAAWFSIIFAAESMWNGKERDLAVFIDALSQQLYGCRLPKNLIDSILNIARNPFKLDYLNVTSDTPQRLALLQYTAAAESFSQERDMLINRCYQMYNNVLGKIMPDYRIDLNRKFANRLLDKLNVLEPKTREILSEFYEPSTVTDFIVSRFGYPRRIADELLKLADKTQPQ